MRKSSIVLIDTIPVISTDLPDAPYFPPITIIKAIRVDTVPHMSDKGHAAKVYLMLEHVEQPVVVKDVADITDGSYALRMHIFEPNTITEKELAYWLKHPRALPTWKIMILEWLEDQPLQNLPANLKEAEAEAEGEDTAEGSQAAEGNEGGNNVK